MRAHGRTKPTVLATAVALLAIAIGATGALAAGTPIDLTTADIQQGPYNGAYFQQGPLPSSAGTGVLDPFLRVNATGNAPEIQRGYNTDWRPLQFDEDGSWTEALLLSTVPTVTGPGGLLYRAFFLDINQTNKTPLLSLDELILFGADSPTYHAFSEATHNFTVPGAADVLWDLDKNPSGGIEDKYLYMDYSLEAGSGDSDVTMLIPETAFNKYTSCQYGQAGCTTWLYLWNRFGDNFANNDGFEEWSTQVLPYVQPSKTATGSYTRTYSWKITKDFDGTYDKLIGDTWDHEYKVTVERSYVDSNVKVTGNITLYVPPKLPDGEKNSPDAVVTNIVDTYAGKTATVTCPAGFPFTVKAGATVVCTYTVALDEPKTGTNEVVVTVQGNPTPFKATAAVTTFTETSAGYKTVDVTDTNGKSWSASGSTSWTYTKGFSCPTDVSLYKDGVYSFEHKNTATITQTAQKDDALVKVNCYAPIVYKTAAGTYGKDYSWKITKDFDGEYWKFIGDPATAHKYKVVVDQTVVDSNFLVAGEISVKNPSPLEMKVALSDKLSSGEAATIGACTDGTYDAGILTIAAGKTAVCKYEAKPANANAGTNYATVTLNKVDFKAEKAYTFTAKVTGDEKVTATDTNTGFGGPYELTGDFTKEYTRDFVCPTDLTKYTAGVYEETVTNTANIKGVTVDKSDTATVKLHCYRPLMSKDAKTTFERKFDWTIKKTALKSELTLKIGQTYMLDYEVTVGKATPWYTDSKWAVSGTISVQNPSPMEMKVSLVDKLSSGELATIGACTDGTYSAGILTIPAGKTAVCKYSADLLDGTTRTNVATATLNKIDFSAAADVKFGDPTSLVDECIKAYDDNATPGNTADDVYLGEVCYTDTLPKTFKFTRQIGPYPICETYKVINTAWIVTNDTKTLKDSSWQVVITVPCEGCTLTQGYWKTHSKYGPAPYDADWKKAASGGGEDAPFFTNGVSWYQMLWMPPKGGNPYIQLAHQWIAAYLNSVKSEDPAPFGDYKDEFLDAQALLTKYTYMYDFKTDPDKVAEKFKYLAGIFSDWNEGYIGPGHCDEDYLSSKLP